MRSYGCCLAASLLFYASGVLSISAGRAGTGCALVALGCAFFAAALTRRKKDRAGRGGSPAVRDKKPVGE